MPANRTRNVAPTDDLADQFKRILQRLASLERAVSSGGGGGGGGIDEVWIGPNDPGSPPYELWYDTDDPAGIDISKMAQVEYGTYTPTFNLFNPGTGATVTATYVWVGPSQVGAVGWLSIQLFVALGTGFTAWTTSHRFGIPPGFNWAPVNHGSEGNATYEDVSAGQRYYGRVSNISTTLCSAGYYSVSGTAIRETVMSGSLPFVWDVGDRYHFMPMGRAVRV